MKIHTDYVSMPKSLESRCSLVHVTWQKNLPVSVVQHGLVRKIQSVVFCDNVRAQRDSFVTLGKVYGRCCELDAHGCLILPLPARLSFTLLPTLNFAKKTKQKNSRIFHKTNVLSVRPMSLD